jgi:hypothetical protein
MNILFLADPNSTHDIKWIEYMVSIDIGKLYLLPRKIHTSGAQIIGVTQLKPISDFSIVRLYKTIYTAIRMRKLIRKNKIDLIHILYAEPNSLWCLFRRFFAIPMVITCRGTDVLKTIPETFDKKGIINLFVAPAYKRAFLLADWVTGTSQLQLNSIRKFSGRDFNLLLVRTGVDLQRLVVDTSNHFPTEVEVPFILFPRYIKPIYNHEFCLNAIELLPKDIKMKYKMVFVGKDNGDAEYQQKLQRLMGTIKDVDFIFLPKLEQEQVFELYKRTSMVVMTPLSDGSPVSAMEALACGATVTLGPLKYDKEIFNENVIQLTSWDEHELTQVITQSLPQERRNVTKEWLTLIDRNSEMEKVLIIYTSVLK